MTSRLAAAVLFLALSTTCSPPRVVRLDTGQGAPREYKPPTRNKSVGVSAGEFERALAQLVPAAPLSLRSPQQGWLVRTSYPSDNTNPRWKRLLGKSIGGICKPGLRRDDCLSLLDDVMGLSEWDKLGVALGLSFDPLRESISQAVQDTLAPQLFYSVIATGLVTWAVLAANPEPVFTKAAAIVSAVMLIYLGVDAFLAVVKACMELKRATDRATTFEELQQASQRFGHTVPQRASVLPPSNPGARSAGSRVPWARRARARTGTISSSRRQAMCSGSVLMPFTTPRTSSQWSNRCILA